MGFIVWIIVGAIAGFLAGKVVTGKGMGLVWDLVVGILGAFVGGWLAGLVGITVSNIVMEVAVAFVGAVVLLATFRALTHPRDPPQVGARSVACRADQWRQGRGCRIEPACRQPGPARGR